jgi:Fe-S-cluster containining protein
MIIIAPFARPGYRRILTKREDPEALALLHADVDRDARRLHVLHAGRLHCRPGCSSCCVDGLTVFDAEAHRIRSHHAELLAHGTAREAGGCAFLDAEGACRIYADRPYVCRTQGLPLRWIEAGGRDAADVRELRDICPLNDAGEPIEALPADDCWTIGPTEERLAQLQISGGGGAVRTLLRDLFAVR